MDTFKRLVTSRRFWIALLAVVVTGLSVAFPQIPPALVGAFQTFAMALIIAFTVDDTATTVAKAFGNRYEDEA